MNAIMDTVKRHNRAGLIGILVIFLALSAALVLLLISLITDELGAQRLERQGVELLVAIKPLQRQIAEHRGACAASASGGAPSYRARCLAAGQAIDASFARLATLKLQLDGAHDLREDISSLAQWWQRLKAQTPALAPDAVIKTHRLLIDEVIELIHSIADRSGLITDSAYDTHYMQEIAVVQLPDYLDRVGYVRVLATRLALAGQSDAASHGVLAAQIEQLRKVDEVLQHASGDIAEIDPLLGRTFSRLAAATTWQTAMFIGLVESRALTGQALDSEDADALFNAGGQALAAGHRLDEVAMHDLRQRLDQRIAQDEQMLLAAGIISVLAVVLVLYIFRRFFVSLTQLEQGEARLEAIFDAATDALVVIDGDGKILQFNHAAETIFGYPSAEVVGNSVNMLMPETLRGPHDGYLSRFQGGTQRTIREIHGLRKDGTAFPLELSISGALVNKRSIFIGIGRDIT
ncbi:MAG: PAS domain S-box protein, partial [Gammaproteobacteria bacterium]|nr:PAS domain S-box protein [Gammaproteobacteria bacterium]